jgi:hypothetical protein
MSSRCLVNAAATASALALLAAEAGAQSVLHRFSGTAPHDQLGSAVAGAGDVDGDGLDDLLVSAPWTDACGSEPDREFFQCGSAWVLSGLDGTVLHAWQGDAFLDGFGWSAAGAGDVDADGRPDLIVGSYNDRSAGYGTGSAHVFSGADGSELFTLHSGATSDRFGWAVDGAGDVDGDGHADLVVGAPDADAVHVYSGADGGLLRKIEFGGGVDFGYSVAGAGDMDGDGRPELIVGAPRRFDFAEDGWALVYSGADGSLLHFFAGQGEAWALFGAAVADAGDVDADSRADVLVGSPVDELIPDEGEAWVFSGRTGAALHRFRAESSTEIDFGQSVDGAGDVDRDGHADLLISVHNDGYMQQLAGGVRVYSGKDGSTLRLLEGIAPGDAFGACVRAAGDVNGDGRPDLIAGAPGADPNGPASGLAEVIACCDFVGQGYCTPAVPNSTGLPGAIAATGSARVGAQDFTLRAWRLPPGALALFLASQSEAYLPGAGGGAGILCLGAPIGALGAQVAGPDGSLAQALDLTDLGGLGPALAGSTWHFQCWYREPLAPTSNLTDALRAVFE